MIPPVASARSDFSQKETPPETAGRTALRGLPETPLGALQHTPQLDGYPASCLAPSLALKPPSRVRRGSPHHASTLLSYPLPDVDLRNPIMSAHLPDPEEKPKPAFSLLTKRRLGVNALLGLGTFQRAEIRAMRWPDTPGFARLPSASLSSV